MLDEFTPAKALWLVRDYNDVVNSHLRKWSGCSDTLRRIIHDRNSAGWRGRGMSDATHAVIAQARRPGLNDASAVALFWFFRNVLFFEQGLDQDTRVWPLRYEKVVTHPEEELRRVFDFIGIDYRPRGASNVVAGSVGKHPPPHIEAPVKELCDTLLARFEALTALGRRPSPLPDEPLNQRS